jgi:hypothetical protein
VRESGVQRIGALIRLRICWLGSFRDSDRGVAGLIVVLAQRETPRRKSTARHSETGEHFMRVHVLVDLDFGKIRVYGAFTDANLVLAEIYAEILQYDLETVELDDPATIATCVDAIDSISEEMGKSSPGARNESDSGNCE